jgi:hypothetical protein
MTRAAETKIKAVSPEFIIPFLLAREFMHNGLSKSRATIISF